jgi:sorting nexin-1/2
MKDGLNKYITYLIKGVDKNGDFEVNRRYSDFIILRKFLVDRWPACFIPPCPSKKAVGNTDIKFVEQRKA